MHRFEDTPFTRCKSDLKVLDYSALGIPGIYSRVTPYAATVNHGETGWLADNTTDFGRDALERRVTDGDFSALQDGRARTRIGES